MACVQVCMQVATPPMPCTLVQLDPYLSLNSPRPILLEPLVGCPRWHAMNECMYVSMQLMNE